MCVCCKSTNPAAAFICQAECYLLDYRVQSTDMSLKHWLWLFSATNYSLNLLNCHWIVCVCVCVCCDCTNPATGRQISADSSCLVGATVSRRHSYGQIGAGYDVRCFTAPHTAAGYLPTAPLSRVAPYFTAAISHADAFHSNQHSVAGADSLQYSTLRAWSWRHDAPRVCSVKQRTRSVLAPS